MVAVRHPGGAKTAITGLAVIYKKAGNLLFPLKDTHRPSDVAAKCKHKAAQHIACYIQAVPYN